MAHVLGIGAKGRTVLPAALRAEVHVGVGDELGGAVERLLADRTADLDLEERRDRQRRQRPTG